MKTNNLKRVGYAMFALLLIGAVGNAQTTITTPNAASPKAGVKQTIGISTISIDYSRPSVNGREGKVWGQLVPYGYSVVGFGNGKPIPWRTGANENTVITFSDDVKIEGKDLAAGSYGLHMAVFENGDIDVIFSNNTTSWGSFWYEESEDALRVKSKSSDNSFTERLTYDFVNVTATSADVVLDWENKRFPFKVEFDVHELVVANAKNQLRSTQGFGFQGPLSAAQYCVNNNVHLDQALIWADQAVNALKNANTLGVKAQVLFATNKNEEAYVVMDEVLDDPTVQPNNYYTYGTTLITQDQDAKALKVFEKMIKKWDANFLAQHGLARTYSSMGDFKKALKYEKLVLANPALPANNKAVIEGYIAKLEKGEDINPN